MSIKLDLSQFKHVKSDGKTTTLQHKQGHTLTLAHSALAPESQAQLKALSGISKSAETPSQSNEMRDQKMAKGGMPCYDEGGSISPASNGQSDAPPKSKSEHEIPSNVSTPSSLGDAWNRVVSGVTSTSGYADGGTINNDENKVPVPGNNGQSDGHPYKASDMARTSQTGDTRSIGQAVHDALNNWWDAQKKAQGGMMMPSMSGMAEGGEIKKDESTRHIESGLPSKENKLDYNQIRQEKRQMNIKEASQPPKRKMYADPQTPVSSDDSAPYQAPDLSQIDPNHAPTVNLPQGVRPPQMQQPGENEQVVGRNISQVADWLNSPAGSSPAAVNPADVAATKADGMVDNLKGKEQAAQQIADAAHDQAADQAQPKAPNALDPMALTRQGLRHETTGATQMAGAQGKLADLEAQSLQQDIARKQDIAVQHQKAFNDLNNERQAFIKDIQNGHIDPEQFWKGDENGNGSHSRVAAGIGMVLAGFNPTGKPNAAVDFLNHQMDRNIDAQKANLASKNNLLAMNLAQYKNLQDASDMTRLMQADIVKSQLQQNAAQVGTPMAQAAAQTAIGQIDAKYQPLAMQMQIRQMMTGLGSGQTQVPGSTGQALSYLDMASPEAAKSYRERYYAPFDSPGGKSIADRPIPTDIRNTLNAQDILDQKGKDVLSFVKQHSGTWNPKARTVATQKIEEMKNFYNLSINGGALTEGRLGWYDEQFKKHPTDILAQVMGSTSKLEEMISSNEARKNTTLASFGLKPPQSAKTQSPVQQWLANPANKSNPSYNKVLQKFQQSGQ